MLCWYVLWKNASSSTVKKSEKLGEAAVVLARSTSTANTRNNSGRFISTVGGWGWKVTVTPTHYLGPRSKVLGRNTEEKTTKQNPCEHWACRSRENNNLECNRHPLLKPPKTKPKQTKNLSSRTKFGQIEILVFKRAPISETKGKSRQHVQEKQQHGSRHAKTWRDGGPCAVAPTDGMCDVAESTETRERGRGAVHLSRCHGTTGRWLCSGTATSQKMIVQ